MANRLTAETSPYLLQHKDNPVDWYPWGAQALDRAAQLDRPIIVSIGYSACHWCHVMERECFEDPEIAKLMNEYFVCIKVDREERPDVDAIYMEALQAMTGRGGWPLNVFITPDQVPFYGGTYFPPEQRGEMPSWPQILAGVDDAWRNRRDEILSQSNQITERLRGAAGLQPPKDAPTSEELKEAVELLKSQFDPINGGFGGAPKFPSAPTIEFLLHYSTLEGATPDALGMAVFTLEKMARGGIYDQIGGGFSRYAVDAEWQVPHFEKMLYDNALLARCYLHAFQLTGSELFRNVCEETLGWALREMRGPEGGFYAALDADSDGIEGKFYVWSLAEIQTALGGDLADDAISYFGVSGGGNFEGSNTLRACGERPERLPEIRCKLFGARNERVRPGLDDKRLTAWNALMISALADAGATLERTDFIEAAKTCAAFIEESAKDSHHRLRRTYSQGVAKIDGFLEDQALMLEASIDLYEATYDEKYFVTATNLADDLIKLFADPENGGFFSTAANDELLVRRKELDDSPLPSGNSSAAYGLLRLAAVTNETRYTDAAVGTIELLYKIATTHPTGFGHLLQAIDFYLAPTQEVAIVGDEIAPLMKIVRADFRPHLVSATGNSSSIPLLRDRVAIDGAATAYVCERFTCKAPVIDPTDLKQLLETT